MSTQPMEASIRPTDSWSPVRDEKSWTPPAIFSIPCGFADSIPTPEIRGRTAVTESLEGILKRDPKALEGLYERYNRILFSVILAIVKRKEDAEEILYDIFMQVWEKAPSFDPSKGSIYGWLLAMARNRSIDRIRSRGYKAQKAESGDVSDMDEFAHPDKSDPLDAVERSQRAEIVRSALGKISPEQRRIIEIAYFEGYSQSEIAEKLDMPLGTVKTRMRDGMKALQVYLKEIH